MHNSSEKGRNLLNVAMSMHFIRLTHIPFCSKNVSEFYPYFNVLVNTHIILKNNFIFDQFDHEFENVRLLCLMQLIFIQNG